MTAKKIELVHKVCDYTCMWNGIEDLYCRASGEMVPDHFFFCLAGKGDFIYWKGNKNHSGPMVAWGDGRTKIMYRKVSDLIGFTYRHIENRTFFYTLKKAKEQIDHDRPVVLGALDMYYLEYYPKIYGKMHIPIHYVLMTGYDDSRQCIFLYDCGMQKMQTLSYEVLEKALDIEKTSLSGKNALCCIEFSEKPPTIKEISEKGLKKKAENALSPKPSFTGISGLRKFAAEFDQWQQILSKKQYDETLKEMLQFSGTVPSFPNRLFGIDQPDKIGFNGCREELGNLLTELGERFSLDHWKEAGSLFHQSGGLIQEQMDIVTDYLIGKISKLEGFREALNQIADLEEKAYQSILRKE